MDGRRNILSLHASFKLEFLSFGLARCQICDANTAKKTLNFKLFLTSEWHKNMSFNQLDNEHRYRMPTREIYVKKMIGLILINLPEYL